MPGLHRALTAALLSATKSRQRPQPQVRKLLKPNCKFEKCGKDLGKKSRKEEKRQHKLDKGKAQPAGTWDGCDAHGTKQAR